MADNVTLPGTGTVVATETVSAAQVQRVKSGWGPIDSFTEIDTGTPLPVVQTGTPALPSGASTSAKQDTGNTSLSSIDGKITAVNTGAVVVSSSALPSGASTSAAQTTGNASLTSIDGKTPALGQALAAASVPVILPSATITTLTPPAAITGFATSAKQDTAQTSLSAIQSSVAGTLTVAAHAVTNAGTFSVQNTSATPAGTNLIGQVAASNETATIYNGTAALTPKFVTIAASASGVTNILALVAAKKIRIVALCLVANGAVNVKFQSHATPTDITGLFYLAANGGLVLPYNPVGWFQTISGEALDINLSGAVAVGGMLTYVEI